MVVGYNVSKVAERELAKNVDDDFTFYRSDEYLLPEYYSSEKRNLSVQSDDVISETPSVPKETTESPLTETKQEEPLSSPVTSAGGPMDSPWPMYGHDARHTGRSPYSTIDTWDLIWRVPTHHWACCSPAIDNDGIIYIGTYPLYAVYPNGTLKWECDLDGLVESSSPAIDENGVIYIGTAHVGNYLHAINPNGTLKWKYPAGAAYTSPAIASDGTIIFSDTNNWNIIALYPNGTQKWEHHTNHVIYSSPAIGQDDTVYCGSHDENVYALYPNNGTAKWKFKTGSWVHGSPTIGDDGTVYIGSDDGYLYALFPNNGTMKWRCGVGAIYASPALDEDGILYVGVWEKKFYAIYPNGTIKWSFNTGNGKVWGSSPALSDDGTIYFGTCDLEYTGGVEIIALYTDGTVKWRKGLNTFFSSPAIGEDGTVYIGSSTTDDGYLVAFGRGELEANANGPYYGLVDEPVQFIGSATGGYSPYTWHWNFGDDHTSEEQNPTHIYTADGNYTITLTVTDNTSNSSSDITWAWIQETNTPPNKPTIDGPTSGKAGTSYDYTVTATDPDGTPLWYYVDWGDDTNSGWVGPYASGQEITLSHTWDERGTYIIKAKAKDPYDEEGPWGTLEVTMPRNKIATNSRILKLLETFPNAFPLLRHFLGR